MNLLFLQTLLSLIIPDGNDTISRVDKDLMPEYSYQLFINGEDYANMIKIGKMLVSNSHVFKTIKYCNILLRKNCYDFEVFNHSNSYNLSRRVSFLSLAKKDIAYTCTETEESSEKELISGDLQVVDTIVLFAYFFGEPYSSIGKVLEIRENGEFLYSLDTNPGYSGSAIINERNGNSH